LVTNEKPVIIFPASTVGRKGCYELREALRGLDVKIVAMGPDIEGVDFWEGFDVERGGAGWMETADLVVLPAFVEHRPRRLLQAAAAGIPVIASSACGVENISGIETIEAGYAVALRTVILSALRSAAKAVAI
jgi:glycosyltransferase involved in cell wall biosynthesis